MVSYGVFLNQDSYLYRQTKTSISNEKSDLQALCTKTVLEHNLNEMIQFGDFKINVKTPKQFDVEVSNSDVRFVYIKHLGIHDTYTLDNLYKSLKSHPTIFIHENFKKLDSLQLLLDVELQELHTKKKFEE